MDQSEVLNIVNRFVSAIKTKYDCKKIFLFGSYARQTNHEESDIDIAIILPEYDNSMDVQLELMRVRRKIDSRIEPHPFRESDFNASNPIASEILKYGREILI